MPRTLLRNGLLFVWAAIFLSGCAAQPVLLERPTPPEIRQEVRLHLPAEPNSLDPAQVTDAATLDLIGNLMEGLVRVAGSAIEGGLAERWEWTDGRQLTFHLRREARWSDGRPVTADDFLYAWYRILDPQSGSDHAYLFYEIAGAEEWNALDPADPNFAERSVDLKGKVKIAAPDGQTLQVTLKEPNPQWAAYTAHPAFFPQRPDLRFDRGSLVAHEHTFVGNGPFRLDRWIPEGELWLSRNPEYWAADTVRLQTVVFHIERDGQTALRLYEMGQLDHVVLPAELAVGVHGAQAMAQPSTMGLVFNTSQPRLANRELRQALLFALDRRRLAYEVAGQSALPSIGLVPPSLDGGWHPGIELIPVQGDQVQARRLWESARRELKVERVTMRLLHARETTALARSVQAMLQTSLDGLTVELHTIPFDQRLERVRFGQFDLVLQGWLAEHDDPLTMLGLFTTDNPANDARWINGEYDQLVTQARRAEGKERRELLVKTERLLLDEAPILPLYHPVRHWVMRQELRGVRSGPLGARLDLRSAHREPAETASIDRRKGNSPGG